MTPASLFSRNWFAVGSLLCFLGLVLNSASAAEDVDPQRFEKTLVQGGLVQPMELDIAPDGRIFLIELAGAIKLIDPKTGVVQVVGQLTVTTAQENGLIGMALDPKFSENGWIYLQYSPPDFSGQYISRFDFRNDTIDMASEKRLFSYEEQRRECCHHAGSMEFGPDGNLYIGTGDNTNPFNDSEGFAPIDQRSDRGPWDAQRTAANTKNYNGKILRIRPEPDGTYSIPAGNLFPRDGSVGHPEIYVMGCRNPWRISLDQQTGFLYWGDVGPDAGSDGPRGSRGYDEVNQARQAGNFGWPYFIGNNFTYCMVDFNSGEIGLPQDPQKPVNRSVNNTGATHLSSLPVVVGNTPPAVEFVAPRDGDFYTPGQPIRYSLVVRDREDGTSDANQAEEDNWDLIESQAATRLFVELVPRVTKGAEENVHAGLSLIRQSDCLNCHAANRRLVGPSFVEIATKYRSDPHSLEKSVARVRGGSTGVWGKVGMLAHPQHTEAEVTRMVEYVYSVTADSSNPSAQGFTNDIPVPDKAGTLRLEATYTDLGRDDIPKLSGVGSVTLRSRVIQAEAADEAQRTQKLRAESAQGKRYMGSIEHDAFLRFDHVPLDGLTAVKVRVASAGAGGVIEVHSGAIDGPLLGAVPVAVNGDWEAFREERIELTAASGRDTVYLVFKNAQQPAALMNIDAVTFE